MFLSVSASFSFSFSLETWQSLTAKLRHSEVEFKKPIDPLFREFQPRAVRLKFAFLHRVVDFQRLSKTTNDSKRTIRILLGSKSRIYFMNIYTSAYDVVMSTFFSDQSVQSHR
jgi:hypothetical protein